MAARYADRVAIIENGRLTAQGRPGPSSIRALSAVFATPIVRLEAAGAVAFLSPGGNISTRT
jgi:ABC-type hemin transport system ATPase subunit